MRRSPIFFLILMGLALAGCSRTAPVYNVTSTPVVAKSGQLSQAQVHDAITKALQESSWVVLRDDPGKIEAEILVNERHRATIGVDYSPSQYSITYKDSDILLYDGTNIHRNYNEWIMNLEKQINRRLAEV